MGFRPNSPPQMTNVRSSRPRALRSLIEAAEGEFVEFAERVERIAAKRWVNSIGIRQIEHRIAGRAKLHALIDAGEKSAGPAGCAAAVGDAGWEYDIARKVFAFAPQAIG